jgi:hypothetical protein
MTLGTAARGARPKATRNGSSPNCHHGAERPVVYVRFGQIPEDEIRVPGNRAGHDLEYGEVGQRIGGVLL